MIRCAVLGSILVLAACTKIGTGSETQPGVASPGPVTPAPITPAPTPPPPGPGVVAPPLTYATPPPTTPPAATVTVQMTAVTLADDCGGTAPSSGPRPATRGQRDESRYDRSEPDSRGRGARARRRCEQTSMQLAVTAASTGAASRVHIKHVELFDDAGKSVGVLVASSPTRWSTADGTYLAWDGTVPAGDDLSVSYVLSQPSWARVPSRWNRTFTLKAIVTVDGGDQAVEHTATISAVTSLPPNVRT